MENWKRRERHENDVKAAFVAAGCTYFPGTKTVQRWRGPEFTAELAKRGHSTIYYGNCSCSRPNPETK